MRNFCMQHRVNGCASLLVANENISQSGRSPLGMRRPCVPHRVIWCASDERSTTASIALVKKIIARVSDRRHPN
jgi:hypothetical protein